MELNMDLIKEGVTLMGTRILSGKSIRYSLVAVMLLMIASSGCQQNKPRIYKVASPQRRAEFRGNGPEVNYGPNNTQIQTAPSWTNPAAPVGTAVNSYHIGSGDVLEVKIYQLLDLNRQEVLIQPVDRRGQIYLPLVNHVQVGGLTCDQVRSELLLRLGQEYIREPQVDVCIKEYASKEVLVLGAVAQPGRLVLQSDRATLLDVIGYAGGLTSEASPDIEIIRGAYQLSATQNPTLLTNAAWQGPTGQSMYSRQVIPVVKVFAEDGAGSNPPIFPGDVIKVPNLSEGFVYLAGEVKQPGAKPFRRPLNILQAVTCAGGTTKIAKEQKCKVIRRTPEGRENVMVVDLEKIMKGDQTNLLLAQNDTILVPVCPTKKFFNDLDNLIRRGISTGVDVTYDAGAEMGFPTRGYP
jgi:polysaccharide export outer membrane protein